MDPSGRLVLITGAARGIGRATAVAFLGAGARVVVADVDEGAARATAEEIGGIPLALDVTDRAAFEGAVEALEREVAPVDVLVNNAGIMHIAPFLEESERASLRQLDVNVRGVLNGMQAVLPRMLRRGRGHIVNIASVAGKMGTPHIAVYSATKHAVIGLTEAVRREHLASGVGFSYVCPSLVATELISGTGRPVYPPPARPEEVAAAVLYAVRSGKVEVYVPRVGLLARVLPGLLPRRLYERVGRAFGIGDMFSTVDDAARAAYRKRSVGE